MRSLTLALIVLTLPVGLAAADDYQLQSLRIEHPFARATPPGARAAGVFLTIKNTGRQPDRLLRVSSPVADVAELHEMKMEAGMMKMRAVQSLALRVSSPVAGIAELHELKMDGGMMKMRTVSR